jgi:hypothetical protein
LRFEVLAAVNIDYDLRACNVDNSVVICVHFGAKELCTKLEAANFSETAWGHFTQEAAFS